MVSSAILRGGSGGVVLAALAGLAACPASGPALRQGVAGDGVAVEVTNSTERTICHLRISRCDLDPPTSHDVLAGVGELDPGSSATVVVPPGCWNFKAQDCGQDFVTGLGGVVVPDTGLSLELTP